MLQEHWLTPAAMNKFDDDFPDYICVGCSAMTERVESGMLFGRPFGGVAILTHKSLRGALRTIHCDDRFAIVKIYNYVVVSVYLPCVGTPYRFIICENIIERIGSWLDQYDDCEYIIGGDFNVNLNDNHEVARCINDFIVDRHLHRCDELFPSSASATYINPSLGHSSYIDYM